jgi:hypothetical protein
MSSLSGTVYIILVIGKEYGGASAASSIRD